MKKIPIQITDDNVEFINRYNISFAKFVNYFIEQIIESGINPKEINDIIENKIILIKHLD